MGKRKSMTKKQRDVVLNIMATTIKCRHAPYVDTYPQDVINDLQERGWAELHDDTREPYQRVYITPDGIREMEKHV
jgi:hypothetical protein